MNERWLQERGEGDAEQQGRKGHHEIGEAHDGGTREAAHIACDNAEDGADEHGDAIGENADHQRRAGAIEHARELVAAERIGAEPEALRGGRGEPSSVRPSKNCSFGLYGASHGAPIAAATNTAMTPRL